jgi:membrane-bound serine protease (ClpP class)
MAQTIGVMMLHPKVAIARCETTLGRLLRAAMPLFCVLLPSLLLLAAPAAAAPAEVVVVALEGPIGPATADYVVRGLHYAEAEHAAAVVLRLDTPGGLDSAMRTIIRAMLASPVPVLGYVAPSGARAASAGTYILYASALAAMAPGTNLGAATPVSLFGDTPLPDTTPGPPGPAAPVTSSAELTKITNDAAAYIRGLATLHSRNAGWAERAVREGVSLSYDAALREHVIDLQAISVEDLLATADGRTVIVAGRPLRLTTSGAAVHIVMPDWRDRLLDVLTNPSILTILLLAGVAGVTFELTHPGIFAPGVMGTICLLLGGYGLNLLPIDYAGVALAVFGLGLMAAEAFVPAFGAFVVGGAAAFLIGALMMFRTPGLRPPTMVLLAATLGAMVAFGVVLGAMLRVRRRPVASGDVTLLGADGRVATWQGGQGRVLVRGEYWNARAAGPLTIGATVRVTGRNGLWLLVEVGDAAAGREVR